MRPSFYAWFTPVLVMLSIVQFAVHMYMLTQGLEFIVSKVTIDDTYYYLLPAWNFQEHQITTFDGINPTNGVQFLWYWLLVPLAYLSTSKETLLYASLVFCALLTAGCYFWIWHIGRTLGRPVLAVAMAVSWFFINLQPRLYVNGMENSLHAFLLWALIALMVVLIKQMLNHQPADRTFLAVTILLVLVVWTRIDTAIYATLVFGYLLWLYWRRRETIAPKTIAVSLFAIAGLGLAMFLGFKDMGGSYLPVSGTIKQDRVAWSTYELIKLVDDTVIDSNPVIIFATLGNPSRILFFVVMVAVPYLALEIINLRNRRQEADGWWSEVSCFKIFFFAFVAAYLAHMIYLSNLGGREWYLSPGFILGGIITGLVLDRAWWLAVHNHQLARYAGAVFVVGCAVLILLAFRTSNLFNTIRAPYDDNHHYQRLQISEWIKENTTEDTILAAWSAGEFGYFSDRTVINMDGLINSYDYYQTVLKGDMSYQEYMTRNNVTYVIDYYIPDEVRNEFLLRETFPRLENGEGPILVLQNPDVEVAQSRE